MPLEIVLRRWNASGRALSGLLVLNMSPDANSQIRKMYDRVANIYGSESRLRRRIIWWSSKLGRFQLPKIEILDAHEDEQWHSGKPVVGLSKDEISVGDRFLESLGISTEDQLICYATRSSSYYESMQSSGVLLKSQNVRNPSENVYLEVAKDLTGRGFCLIRMGKDLPETIPVEKSRFIFDYASDHRSDFLDVYLLNRAAFLISGATGLASVRAILNLPTLNTDFYRILKNWFKDDIALFQKVWLVRGNRLATVGEMVAMGDSFSDERHQERLGVRLVKNTAEEILAACDEMEARLNGTWVTTEEDEILQKKYWDLICDSGHHGGRIGAQFLRDNQDLLR